MRVLILGQGLAGTLMAAFLLEEKCDVLIADPGNKFSSSRVAAGMIHPVTGRRLAKSWMVDELLPFAVSVYRNHENLLHSSFLHEIRTLELYHDNAHRNEWQSRSTEPAFSNYTGNECTPEDVPHGIVKGLGGIYLEKGGWLDTNTYLDCWREYFLKHNQLEETEVAESAIEFINGKVKFQQREFDILIDCRGAATAISSWFGYLPFNPAKGEVISISCDLPELKSIIHKSVKLIPTGTKNNFICGATFSWHALDTVPTEKGRKEIEEKLKRLLELPYTVTDHRAGVRPATKDRRPFAGRHPEIDSLFILNGLGAKGVLLAPYMANELKNLVLYNKQVISEVDIKRIDFK